MRKRSLDNHQNKSRDGEPALLVERQTAVRLGGPCRFTYCPHSSRCSARTCARPCQELLFLLDPFDPRVSHRVQLRKLDLGQPGLPRPCSKQFASSISFNPHVTRAPSPPQ